MAARHTGSVAQFELLIAPALPKGRGRPLTPVGPALPTHACPERFMACAAARQRKRWRGVVGGVWTHAISVGSAPDMFSAQVVAGAAEPLRNVLARTLT